VVSAKLFELDTGLLQLLLLVEFCEFWLLDKLFCMQETDLLVVLLDAVSLWLTDILELVGIMFLLWLIGCELLRRCVLAFGSLILVLVLSGSNVI